MKIKIIRDYDWKVPDVRAWVAFKAGMVLRVTRSQAADMIAAGAAVRA